MDLCRQLAIKHIPRQPSLKLGGLMDLSRSSFDTHATLTVACPPQCALKWHIVAGMMEHYDSRPKSLLEVKKATGRSGGLTPEERVELGQHPLRLIAVSLADRIAADVHCLSVDGRRCGPREALQAVVAETNVHISTIAQDQLINAFAKMRRRAMRRRAKQQQKLRQN